MSKPQAPPISLEKETKLLWKPRWKGWFHAARKATENINNKKNNLDLPVWVPNGSVSGCQFTIPSGLIGTLWCWFIFQYHKRRKTRKASK